MGEKEFVLYPVPAVIIAAGELALNFNKRPETRAAFPAQRTIECHHTVDRMLAGGEIKRTGPYLALWFVYQVLSFAQLANKFDFSDFSEKYKYTGDSTIF